MEKNEINRMLFEKEEGLKYHKENLENITNSQIDFDKNSNEPSVQEEIIEQVKTIFLSYLDKMLELYSKDEVINMLDNIKEDFNNNHSKRK